ncbi:hypothetical protein BH09SUM1_BH09SUM1_01700 [soil metagenome]
MKSDRPLQFEFVVELSVRCSMKKPPVEWEPERRAQYLLKKSVKYPVSADNLAWPFDPRWCESTPFGSMRSVFDEWVQSLDDAAWTTATPVVVTRLWTTAMPIPTSCFSPLDELSREVSLEEIQSRSTFLGYDICDEGLLSLLMNCGLARDEATVNFRDWEELLNEHGLLDLEKLDDGLLKWFSAKVGEHAPGCFFGVYALHRSEY